MVIFHSYGSLQEGISPLTSLVSMSVTFLSLQPRRRPVDVLMLPASMTRSRGSLAVAPTWPTNFQQRWETWEKTEKPWGFGHGTIIVVPYSGYVNHFITTSINQYKPNSIHAGDDHPIFGGRSSTFYRWTMWVKEPPDLFMEFMIWRTPYSCYPLVNSHITIEHGHL